MVFCVRYTLGVAFILSIGLLIALHIKRKETPINLVLLACFTVVEAYTVGNRVNTALLLLTFKYYRSSGHIL